MGANRCGSCDYLNNRDTKWGGEQAWCNYKGYYVKKDSVGCNEYTYHGHRYGRFMITVVEQILNKDLLSDGKFDNLIMEITDNNTIDVCDAANFYDDYLKYGPTLAQDIINDKNSEYISTYILQNAIEPTLEYIDDKKYDKAFELYTYAFYAMLNYYDNNKIIRTK